MVASGQAGPKGPDIWGYAMSDAYRAVIPYESLDPLTIGSADDESKVYRETLELDIPSANLLAAIYPDEPEPVGDTTEAARHALENPHSGPRFSDLLAGKSSVAVVIDNENGSVKGHRLDQFKGSSRWNAAPWGRRFSAQSRPR